MRMLSRRRPSPEPLTEDVVPYDWQESSPQRRPAVRWALRIALALLVVLLAGQALFQFRHWIAASYPQFRPHLVAACASSGLYR
jgi:hypothetical protein